MKKKIENQKNNVSLIRTALKEKGVCNGNINNFLEEGNMIFERYGPEDDIL